MGDTVLVLFVRDSDKSANREKSVEILEYVLKNIKVINDMKVHIRIVKVHDTKVSKELKTKLAEYKITKLPTLITDAKKTYVGVASIRDLFESQIEEYRKFITSGGPSAPSETDDSLKSYQEKLMNEGEDPENDESSDMMDKYRRADARRKKSTKKPAKGAPRKIDEDDDPPRRNVQHNTQHNAPRNAPIAAPARPSLTAYVRETGQDGDMQRAMLDRMGGGDSDVF